MLNRRQFLGLLLVSAAAPAAAEKLDRAASRSKEALYYVKQKGGVVGCRLCPRTCSIAPGDTGFCRARRNVNGTLYTLGYGLPCAIHVDPIEKKPFFHYLPRSLSFSFACAGCNLRCKFCQNWQISQISPADAQNYDAPSDMLVKGASNSRSRSVAYTYTEPTTFYEFMTDTARLARDAGLANVYHSNGFINPEPLKHLASLLDAANIDLKGFSDDFYGKVCEAELSPVLNSLVTLKKAGVWVEITNLVIPGYNDDMALITKMAQWIKANLGSDVPLHFSRFFPLYKMTNITATPVETLERARDAAMKAGIAHVYVGNVPGHGGGHTFCPKCRRIVVKRAGFTAVEFNAKNGACAHCGERMKGRWA